jgi:hypothetical protein
MARVRMVLIQSWSRAVRCSLEIDVEDEPIEFTLGDVLPNILISVEHILGWFVQPDSGWPDGHASQTGLRLKRFSDLQGLQANHMR